MIKEYKVVIIGGGPAGLAAARSSAEHGASTLIIERATRLGGILKQCIHDGFGVQRYHEKLSGPEYAEREMKALKGLPIDVALFTYVTHIKKAHNVLRLTLVSSAGVETVLTNKLILATGCRERTAKQVSIYGTNPAGVMTAGQAQYYINMLGQMPTRRCVILGSGDIGMIMARRITLEGGTVLGVYEAKPAPSGLARNISQCLEDYDIPLHLSMTVTRVFGEDRLEAVEVAKVDAQMQPIPGTEERLECDALILSVGLIPENEIATTIGVPLNPKTKGPKVDQRMETEVRGVYSCGNALHVNDLVDYVSESGELAGASAALDPKTNPLYVDLITDAHFGYMVPTHLNLLAPLKTVLYFRVNEECSNKTLHLYVDGQEVFKRRYIRLRPPEMERFEFDFSPYPHLKAIRLTLEDN